MTTSNAPSVTPPEWGSSVTGNHPNAPTAKALTTTHTLAMSRRDNRVTKRVTHAVTLVPVPVPAVRSPTSANPPTAVVTCSGHQKSRSLANVMRQPAASERQQKANQ
jgi:hypothetical protein